MAYQKSVTKNYKGYGASWMSAFYHHETVIHHISNKDLNICDASRWSELGDCHLAIYITASTRNVGQSCQTVFVVEHGSLGTRLGGIKLVSIFTGCSPTAATGAAHSLNFSCKCNNQ